jgi:Tfp pilus assembly protein PilV
VATRVREENGFGMVELLVAIVMLNIGILALMGSFASSTLSLRGSGYTSNATVLADKAIEVYRDLYSSAIYLTQASITAAPAAYATYGSATNRITDSTNGSTYADISASKSSCLPKLSDGSLAITWMDPTNATQTVTGPDGKSYTMYVYVNAVQPTGAGGTTLTTGYTKQVTVAVFSPVGTHPLLAKETSIFEPNATGTC